MKNVKNLERLQQLHMLIENENTGTPKELAEHMNISERKIHQLIGELKDLDAEICYSRSRKTYYYCDDFKLMINISVTVLSNNEITELYGGSYFLKKKPSLQGLCSERDYISHNKTKICA
ncbi:HTH domain-containing protein [Galbibacter sp. EGI 63066]|uniref:HTH domain-containing protein n=1 Tax=Galbibacter sp. EGI 63066 TaxID=2993559 RepID=UPI0022493273|nr:HTH domain-containing protein [Galbibacter sp. EGI 63066]MCX2678902.1 HTH domain-containing protein [Galbibacter sp. EGI 63066]